MKCVEGVASEIGVIMICYKVPWMYKDKSGLAGVQFEMKIQWRASGWKYLIKFGLSDGS
jgi:hypothetical protein